MSDPTPRLMALGNQLIDLHQRLRQALSDFSGMSGDLAVHCLAFCSALQRHHDGEEQSLFPYLETHYPDLRPLVAELRRDHEQLADLIRRVAANPTQTEVATLQAVMESHFTYEERRLVPLLNALS
ncbi:hemerythrin domain-containing protein [Dactylosporangium sp. NPDC051485]|uniref:hemerythrin domain-containing protein n=1 Tax=Dactylosporangium sp. NPDC051485 TaxID=3154846 RepID=UPI0034343B8C